MVFKKVTSQVSFSKMEEAIIDFWDKEKIFEKSIERRPADKLYSFYDGPPFATGTPHYGHIVASAIKDTVPRYFTMKGYRVERKWGWDCHGLPIENIAEKELGIAHKKEILEIGVEKFNDVCRSKVLEYTEEWKKVMRRFGRWADMENAYKTMDLEYMESVWWVFAELWKKNLIYESYRTMHICPRCETTLSQSEVAEGYKDVKDLSVTVKFEMVDEPGTFILAWTTTPWTLPGNVALAVGKDIVYQKVNITGEKEKYIVAKEKLSAVFADRTYHIIEEMKGEALIGKLYIPPFDYYFHDETLKHYKNGWKIYHADFVTTEMGTGIAHEAPAFGEEDMELGKINNLPWVQHVSMDGTMKQEVRDFAGMPVKERENPQAMDIEIIKYLSQRGLLFAKEKYEHSYPHCWRCDTPLLNYATSSWFVRVTDIKPKMLELAHKIHWSPEHIKEGRWGKWLEGARDWSISRQRYWASVMPLWKCECGEMRVFGSVKELEDASSQKIEDLHKHYVDSITVPCEKCGEMMHRIPDVLDTWFDSGSMPYAEVHYPFENTEKFEKTFPANFIAEGIDQTRAWFYYQHIIGTAIKESNAFQNVIVNGIVLAEDGKKMSKRLKNYPDPMEMLNKYGADALRYYLLSSPIVSAENLNFSERDLSDIMRNIFRMLWNSYSFFITYAVIDMWEPKKKTQPSKNILDRWIVSELQILIKEVDEAMEKYELNRATRAFAPFVDNLSNWYIRRSRDRFWKSEDDSDKESAYQTLYDVLVTLSKIMAPFTPFIAEEIYTNLTNEESVHLADWPSSDESLIDEQLNGNMKTARFIVSLGLQKRSENKIKVRQPLQSVNAQPLGFDLEEIVKEELNVKKYDSSHYDEKDGYSNMFDFTLTPELKLEGEMNEINRAIQSGRKKANFNVDDRVILFYEGKESVFEKFGEEIAKKVLATKIENKMSMEAEYTETVSIEGESFTFSLKRIEV